MEDPTVYLLIAAIIIGGIIGGILFTKLERDKERGFKDRDDKITNLEREKKRGFKDRDDKITNLEREKKRGFKDRDDKITNLEKKIVEKNQQMESFTHDIERTVDEHKKLGSDPEEDL